MLVARGRIENRQAIVRVGFQPFAPQSLALQPSTPAFQVPVQEYRALIDTGAQRTCLCRSVILKEGLTYHGKKIVQNVHALGKHYLYWAQVGFFCERVDPTDPSNATVTYFGLPEPIEVIDIADNSHFDAIVGMDLISRCELKMASDGDFALRLA